jgi:protein-tyrosine phosphatase
VIDLHSHILPGVDDGARTLADSLEIARSAVADGVEVVAATPHVRADYPTEAATMHRLVGELRGALDRERIPLELLPGGELALEAAEALTADELASFTLGDGRCLLLEFPYGGWPLGLAERVFRFAAQGFTPLLAHPERNREVQAAPERLEPLVQSGALVQLTAASLDGRLGRGPQQCARRLLELELAHAIASDAHAPSVRQIGMSAARAEVGDDALAAWLTEAVPRALLDVQTLPPRPAAGGRRRSWLRVPPWAR